MQVAFLMIITLAGIIYSFWTKQNKIALGLLVLMVSLTLQIPNLVTGFWVDIFSALSLIIFALAIFVIVFKKKEADLVKKFDVKEEEKDEISSTR